jgi:dTDP-4-dehydrorhamnose reductase
MRIAITGVKGMLGSELALRAAAAGHDVKGYDLPELDITRNFDPSDIHAVCDLLVNCAAYTDVDGAESSRAAAYAVNDAGAGRLAMWCSSHGVRMVHISTDYIFDGESKKPYKEDDKAKPLGVYGASKLAGEISVLDACPGALIVRTQALFGPRGKSFPAAIIAKLDDGKDLEVVNDQTMCPTCTGHVADAILDLIKTDAAGLLHVSSSGSCTWYELAAAIVSRIKPGANIKPVTSDRFPRPAKRPKYSVLDKSRFERLTGRKMPDWKDALDWYLGEIGNE